MNNVFDEKGDSRGMVEIGVESGSEHILLHGTKGG